MAIQLTLEQEQRIQAVVNAGAYPSTKEALDAVCWFSVKWSAGTLR